MTTQRIAIWCTEDDCFGPIYCDDMAKAKKAAKQHREIGHNVKIEVFEEPEEELDT